MAHHILIASYLEPEYVERIRKVDPHINVLYDPDLVAPPRYAADHTGGPFKRTEHQESKWQMLLGKADILFDFDRSHLEDLPVLAPNLKWIQATSSGIGQTIHRFKYDIRMPHVIFTSARGVHARPLAEFCLLVMLSFNKGFLPMIESQKNKHWERYAGTDLNGRTIGIIGMGKVGAELARVCQCMGMTVLGVKRNIKGIIPPDLHADELYDQDQMKEVLNRSEYLVLITPHTPETENMIGKEQIMALPKGAVLINIGRGACLDEEALIECLRTGHLRGAGLDVFAEEPLPETSPLWTMNNVIVSPHSGSTSDRENGRITDIFCANIKNFLEGKPLINVIDTNKMF